MSIRVENLVIEEKAKRNIIEAVDIQDIQDNEEFLIDDVVVVGTKKNGYIVIEKVLPKL